MTPCSAPDPDLTASRVRSAAHSQSRSRCI
jgi:hypothetical protein